MIKNRLPDVEYRSLSIFDVGNKNINDKLSMEELLEEISDGRFFYAEYLNEYLTETGKNEKDKYIELAKDIDMPTSVEKWFLEKIITTNFISENFDLLVLVVDKIKYFKENLAYKDYEEQSYKLLQIFDERIDKKEFLFEFKDLIEYILKNVNIVEEIDENISVLNNNYDFIKDNFKLVNNLYENAKISSFDSKHIKGFIEGLNFLYEHDNEYFSDISDENLVFAFNIYKDCFRYSVDKIDNTANYMFIDFILDLGKTSDGKSFINDNKELLFDVSGKFGILAVPVLNLLIENKDILSKKNIKDVKNLCDEEQLTDDLISLFTIKYNENPANFPYNALFYLALNKNVGQFIINLDDNAKTNDNYYELITKGKMKDLHYRISRSYQSDTSFEYMIENNEIIKNKQMTDLYNKNKKFAELIDSYDENNPSFDEIKNLLIKANIVEERYFSESDVRKVVKYVKQDILYAKLYNIINKIYNEDEEFIEFVNSYNIDEIFKLLDKKGIKYEKNTVQNIVKDIKNKNIYKRVNDIYDNEKRFADLVDSYDGSEEAFENIYSFLNNKYSITDKDTVKNIIRDIKINKLLLKIDYFDFSINDHCISFDILLNNCKMGRITQEQKKEFVEKLSKIAFEYYNKEKEGTVIPDKDNNKTYPFEDFGNVEISNDNYLKNKRNNLTKLYNNKELFTSEQRKDIFKNEIKAEQKLGMKNDDSDMLEIKDFDRLPDAFRQMFLDGSIKSIANLKEYIRPAFDGDIDEFVQKNPQYLRDLTVAEKRNINGKTEVNSIWKKFKDNYDNGEYKNVDDIFESWTGFSVNQIKENENKDITINGRKYKRGQIFNVYRDDILLAIVTVLKNNNESGYKEDFKKLNKNNYDFQCSLLKDGPCIMTYTQALNAGYITGDCTGRLANGQNNENYRNNRLFLDNFFVVGYFKEGKLIQKYMCHFDEDSMHIMSMEDIPGFRPNKTNENDGDKNDGGEYGNIDFEGQYFFESLEYISQIITKINKDDKNYKNFEINHVYIDTDSSNTQFFKDIIPFTIFTNIKDMILKIGNKELTDKIEIEYDKYHNELEIYKKEAELSDVEIIELSKILKNIKGVSYQEVDGNLIVKVKTSDKDNLLAQGKLDSLYEIDMDELKLHAKAEEYEIKGNKLKILRTLTGHKYNDSITDKFEIEQSVLNKGIVEGTKGTFDTELPLNNDGKIVLNNEKLIHNFAYNLVDMVELLNLPVYALTGGQEGFILEIGQNKFLKVEKNVDSYNTVSNRYATETGEDEENMYEDIKQIINEKNKNGKYIWDFILNGQIKQYNKREKENIKLPEDYNDNRNKYIKQYKNNAGKKFIGVKVKTENKKEKILYFEIIESKKTKWVELKTEIQNDEIKKDTKGNNVIIDVKEQIKNIKSQGYNLEEQLEDELKKETIIVDINFKNDEIDDVINDIKNSKKKFDEELRKNKIDMNDEDGRKKIIKIEKDYAPKCGTYYDKLVEYGIEDKELLDFAFYMKVINLAENKNFDELKNIIEDKDLDIKYRLFALTYFGAENDINEINSDTLKGLREQFIEDFIQNKIQIEEKDNFALRAVSAGIFLIERDKFSNFIDNQNNSIYKNFFEKNLKSVFVNKNTAAGNANAEFYYVYSDKIIRNIAHEQGHFFHSEFSFSSLPLNREGVFNFLEYSAKELFAEISSAMVCKELDVEFKTTDCLYKLYNNEKYKEYEKYFAQQEYRTAEGLIYLLEAVFSSANEKDVNYELLAMAVSQVLNNCYLYDALKSYPGQREMLLGTINPLAANTFKTSGKLISDANEENIDLSNISDQSTMLRNILEVYFIYLKNYGNLDTTVVDNIEEMLKETDSWKALVPELFEKLENYEEYDGIIKEIIKQNNDYISYYRANAHEKLNLEDSKQVIANMVLSRPDKTLEVLNIIEDQINIDGEINEKERDILVLISAIKYAYNETKDQPAFISAKIAKEKGEEISKNRIRNRKILENDVIVKYSVGLINNLNDQDNELKKRIKSEFGKNIEQITWEDVAFYLAKDDHDFGIFSELQDIISFPFLIPAIGKISDYRNDINRFINVGMKEITLAENNNYLNIEKNKENKDYLISILNKDIDAKFKLYALNYLITIHNVDVSQEIVEKIKKDFVKQMSSSENKNIKNNFDLKAYATGIFLLISNDEDKDILEKIMKQAVFVRKNPNEPETVSNEKLEFVFDVDDSELCVSIAKEFGCEKEEFEKILNDYKNKTDSDESEQYQEAFIGKALFSNIPGVNLITQTINRRYYTVKGDIVFNDNWNINDQIDFINKTGEINKDNTLEYPNLNAGSEQRDNYRNEEEKLLNEFIDNGVTSEKFSKGEYKNSNNYAYIYYLYRENKTKSLKIYLENKNNKIEHRLYALMYLKILDENIDKKVEDEIKEEYKEKIKTKGYRNNIKNNFDLKAHITGIMLILEKDFTELANIAGKSDTETLQILNGMYEEIPNAIFLGRLPTIYLIKRAYSDLAFSVDFEDDLNDTVIHELMHIFVEKAGFENENEIGLSLNELFAYIASNEYSLNEEDKKDEKKTDSFSFISFNEEHNFSEMFIEVMDMITEPFTGEKLSGLIVKFMFSAEFKNSIKNGNMSQLELRNKIFDIYLEDKDEAFIKNFEETVNEIDFGWQSVLYNALKYFEDKYPNEYSQMISAIEDEVTDENGNIKVIFNTSYRGKYSRKIEDRIKTGDADTIAYNVILAGKQPNKKILEIFLNKIPQKEQYLKTVLENINNKDYLYQEKNKKGDNFLFNATYIYNKQQSNEHQNNIFLYGIQDNFVGNIKVLNSFDAELDLREEAINSKLMDSIINNGNNFILLDFDTMPSDIEITDVLKDIDLSNSKVYIRYNLDKFNDESYEKKLTGLKKKLSELGIPDTNIVNNTGEEILKQLIRKKVNEGDLENLNNPLTFQSKNFNFRYKGLEVLVLDDVVYDDDEITDIFKQIPEGDISEFFKYKLVFKRLNFLNSNHVEILERIPKEIDAKEEDRSFYITDKNKSEELLEICNDLETKIEKKLEEKTKEITDYNKNEIFRDDKIIFNGSVDDRKININIDSEEFFEKYEPMNLYKAFNEIKNKDSSKVLVLGKSDYKHQKYRPNGIKLLDALCGKKAKLWQQYYRENIFEKGVDGGIVAKPYDLIVKINEDINNGKLTDVYFFLNENMGKLDRNNNPSHSFSEILILLDMKENGSDEEQRIAENVIEHTTFVVGTDSFLDFAEDILKDLEIDIGEISTYQLSRLFDKIFEWQETKDSEEKESMDKINNAAILPENENYVNKSISEGKSSLRILLGIAWKEFLKVYKISLTKDEENKNKLGLDFVEGHESEENKKTASILTKISYAVPAVVGALSIAISILMPAIPVVILIGAFIASIFGSNIGVHVILDFKAIKARQELFKVLSEDIISSAIKEAEIKEGQETELSIPVYVVSEGIGKIIESGQLKNTGLKTPNGESIFAVKTDGAIVLGTRNGASAKEIAETVNESKVLEDLVKSSLRANAKQSAINIKFDIVVEDKDYVKEKQKDKNFKDSNIIFENGMIIVNKIEGQTRSEIIKEFKELSAAKQTIGITMADKMIISLESVKDKENLKKAINNGKARKVITVEQYSDLGMGEKDLIELKNKGIEVYIKEGNKILEFDTKNEIEFKPIEENMTMQQLQQLIRTSDKPLLIEINKLAGMFKSNQTDIMETYSMLDTLIGNIKLNFGIGQLSRRDIEYMAYNIPFDKIPKGEFDIETDDSEIGIMYRNIKDKDKKLFKETIDKRIKIKNLLNAQEIKVTYTERNEEVKKLEKLLINEIEEYDINKVKEELNRIREEQNNNINSLEETKAFLYEKLLSDEGNKEKTVATILAIMDIIADDNEQTGKIDREEDNLAKDYRAMLAAA